MIGLKYLFCIISRKYPSVKLEFLFQSEIDNARTVSEIEEYLLKPLQRLKECKDEKELLADLWCHFGKVLVSSVDEGADNILH